MILSYENVSVGYGRKVVLAGLDLEIREGAYLGIVGPNGAGKTTFLKSVLGLLAPSAGRIRRRPGRRPRIGYVPQRQALDPIYPLLVEDVVRMGILREVGTLRPFRAVHRQRVEAALAAAGIQELARIPYRELSGGQQQRSLIARALVGGPELLVLDEPTNGMDLAGERSVMQLVDRLFAEGGRTVLLVSHLLQMTCRHVKELALIAGGRMVHGPLDEVFTDERLSAIYGVPVRVGVVGGERVVIADRGA